MKKRRIRTERVVALVIMIVWIISAIAYFFMPECVAPEYNMACCILGCIAAYNAAINITELRKMKVRK